MAVLLSALPGITPSIPTISCMPSSSHLIPNSIVGLPDRIISLVSASLGPEYHVALAVCAHFLPGAGATNFVPVSLPRCQSPIPFPWALLVPPSEEEYLLMWMPGIPGWQSLPTMPLMPGVTEIPRRCHEDFQCLPANSFQRHLVPT